MKLLKRRKTRITAFIIACLLTAFCTFRTVNAIVRSDVLLNRESDYLCTEQYTHEINSLYDDLWLIGNIYLKNVDENGKYTCNDAMRDSIEKTLSELGLMNSSGEIEIDDKGKFEYYVSYNNISLTNTDKNMSDISTADKYTMTYADGDFLSLPQTLVWWYHNQWYSTNYGMYYYLYSGGAEKTAVFDYYADNLDYYTDDYGVKIYYKTDGSTPMPVESFTEEYANEYEDSNFYDYETEPTMANEIYDYENGETMSAYNTEFTQEYANEYEDGDYYDYVTEPTRVYDVYNSRNGDRITVDVTGFTEEMGSDRFLKIAIKPVLPLIDTHEQEELKYASAQNYLVHTLMYTLPFAVLLLILTIYIFAADGWNVISGKYMLKNYDNIWAEGILVVIAVAVIGAIGLVVPDSMKIVDEFLMCYTNMQYATEIFYSAAMTLLYAIIVFFSCSILRRIKCRSLIKTSLTGKMLQKILSIIKKLALRLKSEWRNRITAKELIRNDVFTRKFLIRIGVCGAAEIFAVFVAMTCNSEEIFVICSILILALYIFLNFNDLQAIKKLSEHIAEISKGDYTAKKVPETAVTYNMTQNLNNISVGIQNTVEKQIKSERMKIELVTNVSHDLKTPLTSIISYINLLSAEELSPEAADYVKILEQKSERLKLIVSDLFDIAKASSNTDMEFENIDAVILISQVMADMEDKIKEYSREMRTDISLESAPIYADGKKLYRVFQNLIINALKYSLEGTRIYIRLYEKNNSVFIELKNISAYEMKFTPEEITERFTRGDESRTSEGNGLGLSIAKSFTEACGGAFNIKIDGDVFIAEVKFNLNENLM